MKGTIWLLSVLLLLGGSVLNAQEAQPAFNGLGMGMGNLSRLSHAKTRSISAENMTGEKGKGGMATKGTGAERRARTRPDLEGLALRGDRAQASFHHRRDSRARRHSAHLDDPHRELAFLHPAHLLGWRA